MTAPDQTRHVVLVVDDEPIVRLVASEAFRDVGCHTYEAGRADEALEVMEQHPDISVLLADINMPGDGGVRRTLKDLRQGGANR